MLYIEKTLTKLPAKVTFKVYFRNVTEVLIDNL